jgi:hypothetical protein
MRTPLDTRTSTGTKTGHTNWQPFFPPKQCFPALYFHKLIQCVDPNPRPGPRGSSGAAALGPRNQGALPNNTYTRCYTQYTSGTLHGHARITASLLISPDKTSEIVGAWAEIAHDAVPCSSAQPSCPLQSCT